MASLGGTPTTTDTSKLSLTVHIPLYQPVRGQFGQVLQLAAKLRVLIKYIQLASISKSPTIGDLPHVINAFIIY